MSDTPDTQEPVDPKRAAMLARLAVAREKAKERRLEIGNIARREKEIRQQMEDKRKARLAELEQKAAVLSAKKCRQKIKAPITVQSESDDSSESEEEEEAPPTKPIKRVGAKRHDPVENLHSSYLTAQIAREQLAQRIAQENYNTAFSSLFPGYRFMP